MIATLFTDEPILGHLKKFNIGDKIVQLIGFYRKNLQQTTQEHFEMEYITALIATLFH